MTTYSRYIKPLIKEYLEDKMVFVGGPRQVGKTTVCLSFLKPPNISNPAYLNWDDLESKAIIKSGNLPPRRLILLDEVHKFKNWRNLVKGFYDKRRDAHKFLITGSARLDYYRRGGDSLLGRYRYIRLHPFSVNELKIDKAKELKDLLNLGGFPDPLFKSSERHWKLWSRERLQRIVNDDIRGLESLKEYSSIELLAEALPQRIGSPLSINSLAEDLAYNHRTLENWMQILEKIYYCYRIMPYGPPKIRAVKKEKKVYLWDWSQCQTEGAKFENLVAGQLLKYCHWKEDRDGDKMELRYIRDTDKREIDFVVLENNKPLFAVECKVGETTISPHISYFKARTPIPYFYQVHLGEKDYTPETNVRVLPFLTFCKEIKAP